MADDPPNADELIREGYDAFNRGDFDAAASLLHPEIVWHRAVDIEHYIEGADAAKELMEPSSFSEQHNDVHSIEQHGEFVIVDVTFRAVGAGSGIELDQRTFHVWRVEEGAAVEFWAVRSRPEAVALIEGD
jgi:ketosteroid isomerase-like protein